MIRVLVLIAVTGFVTGVVALAGAAALGGPELASRGWSWSTDWHDHDDDDHPHRDREWREERPQASDATRELVWDGSTSAFFDLPAAVEFSQAAGPGKVVITGPKELIEKVTLAGGRLSLDQPLAGQARLRVVMTAPSVTRFEIGGDDRLEIRDYKQDQLTIVASGSSEVLARGETRALDLELSGSGEADLTGLTSESASADVSGSAEATIAPKESATLEVSGSGSVRLVTRPKHLESDVAGAGSVIFDDGGRSSEGDKPEKQGVSAQET